MTRDEDPTRGEVITTVPLVIRGIPEENTECRAGGQLMRSGGSGVRVTRTPEDTKVVIPRRGTEKSVVRCRSWASSGRKAVEEIGGSVEALSPKASWERSLEKEGAHDVVRGTNHALGLAVLRGGVWARHAQLDTMGEEESARSGVVELTAIVTLNGLDGEAELSRHPSEEVEKGGESVRLGT
jgi:hypothetical protein